MIIKLEFISKTEKAYELPTNVWIPKSVLDARGLKHPYYQVKNWWLNIHVENVRVGVGEENIWNKNKIVTSTENEISILILKAFQPMVTSLKDMPTENREYWGNYWKTRCSELGSPSYDMEPRLWGNDCFHGDPNNQF